MSPNCFGIGAVSALWLSGRNCPYFRVVPASWLFRPESLSCLWSVDTYVIGDSVGSAKNETVISNILQRKLASTNRISTALAQALPYPFFAAKTD